jgi:hypothetical protein
MAWLPLLDAYTDALTKAMDPNRGKVDVLRKNQDKATLKTAVRNFIKAYVMYNPNVTDVDLKNSAFDTKTPYLFSFDESDRGKALYICARWENNINDKGPWGEIVKAIVP